MTFQQAGMPAYPDSGHSAMRSGASLTIHSPKCTIIVGMRRQ